MTRFPARILRFAFAFCFSFSAVAAFPPAPADGRIISDVAGVIDAESVARIEDVQKRALEEYGTPIVVVTIRRMADYDGSGRDIKDFARAWFNHWKIGSRGANKGILVLVSTLDRKARIELGADWGRSWDGECQRIMDRKMVPQFKRQAYSRGIADGVAELASLTEIGPGGVPPQPPLLERANNAIDTNETVRDLRAVNPYSANTSVLMIGVGIVLIIAGIFVPTYRKLLLISGAVLVVAGISIIAIFAIAALFGKRSRYSGGSSGGGFSGGFSGGGGASGSW